MPWIVLGVISVLLWFGTRMIRDSDLEFAKNLGYKQPNEEIFSPVREGYLWRGVGLGFIVAMWLTALVFSNFVG